MRRTSGKLLAVTAAVACLAFATCERSNAATINLNIDSLDVMYDGAAAVIRDLSPDGTPAGGSNIVNEADRVDGATFTLDGAVQQQYMFSDMVYGDLLVKGLPNTLPAPDLFGAPPTPVTFELGDNSEGPDDHTFGFNWFQHNGASVVSSLELEFDTVVVTLQDIGAGDPVMTISAATTEWSQFNLPNNLEFAPGSQLTFSFTSQNTAAVPPQGGDYTNILAMEGVLTISGQSVIPEPGAAYLLLTALGAAVAGVRWRLG